jgi:N-acyl-D-amino-acid deacylase
MRIHTRTLPLILLTIFTISCAPYDLIIRNGRVVDGTGQPAYRADVGVKGNTIRKIGDLSGKKARKAVNAEGLVVSPGFVNVLSWGYNSLLADGRSMSNIKQGVTLEIFGEGSSPGPLSDKMKRGRDLPYTTLGEALEHLTQKGVATNVASFVGATTVRIHVLEYENRPPDAEELRRMQELVRQAMREGALGLGTSLIYPPAFFASTDELIALSRAAAEYGGVYISHLRSEGDAFLEAVDELLKISSEASIPAEIYHLKAAGQANWPKLDQVLARIDSARAAGLAVSANMYSYTAASTGLDATLPPWTQEGGTEKWLERLADSLTRDRILAENFFLMSGSPDNILLCGFDQDSLRKYTGKTLAEVAALRNTAPECAVIDLLLANGGDIQAVYFLMSEENVQKQLRLPYMSFGSDAGSVAAEGDNLRFIPHPRTYGNFSRVLGKYVREEKVLSLEDAVRKLSALPAEKLRIAKRHTLAPSYFADIVVFDPEKIRDKATFTEPHQYAEGMIHVFVNGVQVLENGNHTGAMPGQVVRGPGYRK